MKDDQQKFLAISGKLPARLLAEQVAWVLNCQSYEVPILVAARLLKPLGNPSPNAVKYFAAMDILEMSSDKMWLNKISNAISHHWQIKNSRQKKAMLQLSA